MIRLLITTVNPHYKDRRGAAAKVIRHLAKERPALLSGAGTVLTPETPSRPQ